MYGNLEYRSCYLHFLMTLSCAWAGQMLAVLVVASWSKQSHYSSSAHAEIVAQAAFSELKAAGEAQD